MPLFFSSLLFAFLMLASYSASGKDFTGGFFLRAIASLVVTILVYRKMTEKERKLQHSLKEPFPADWDDFLKGTVLFYRELAGKDKERFQYELRKFMVEKRITAVNTEITDKDRLLVACSAVIPVFGFKGWTYHNLNEVLLYPNAFSQNFSIEGGKDRNVQGMVGTGFMNGTMILSLPELRNSFRNSSDKHNVGIHEFIHLLDKADGSIDGIPEALVEKAYALPWLELMRNEISAIKKRKSDINPYGAVGQEEFLAVAGEYFFERPDLLKAKHPDLYKLLRRIFRQDMATRLKNSFKKMVPRLSQKGMKSY